MWKLSDFSDTVALIKENGEPVLYSELEYEADKITRRVEKRSLVFVLCSNAVQSLAGYIGFVNNRIVPLMLDAGIDKDLLANLYTIYKPGYFWMPENVKLDFSGLAEVYKSGGYVLLKTSFANNPPLDDELALLLTTSGSTGSPKLVRQSYANILANTESIVKYLEMDNSHRSITTLPMNYTYGLSIINTHLYAGASIVITTKTLMQKEFWNQINDYQVTNFGGVPYTYEMLKRLRFFNMELPYLKYITQAGGKLSADLCLEYAKALQEKGKDFIVMYGATEATARMSYVPRNMAVEKAGSIGIAIPGGRFELVDENGNLIEDYGKTGELIYYGPNVTMGYAECVGDLAKADDWGGRYETGDMAKIDKDGYYYIVGRKKRFLKLYGNRVNLEECEHLLKKQFPDIDIACTGVDDLMYVFVTCEKSINDVGKHITQLTGINRAGFKVCYIENIPKNPSGKILYKELESLCTI